MYKYLKILTLRLNILNHEIKKIIYILKAAIFTHFIIVHHSMLILTQQRHRECQIISEIC